MGSSSRRYGSLKEAGLYLVGVIVLCLSALFAAMAHFSHDADGGDRFHQGLWYTCQHGICFQYGTSLALAENLSNMRKRMNVTKSFYQWQENIKVFAPINPTDYLNFFVVFIHPGWPKIIKKLMAIRFHLTRKLQKVIQYLYDDKNCFKQKNLMTSLLSKNNFQFLLNVLFFFRNTQ